VQTMINKDNFKKIISKVTDLKFLISLFQEILFLLFKLVYGNKPLFTI